jgi:hypothetical protein
VEWVARPSSLPDCSPTHLLQIYHENAFHVEALAKPNRDVATSAQLITADGTEGVNFCLDHGIEDGSYLRLVGLACLDRQLLCSRPGSSCLNTCCADKSVRCQLPPLLRQDFVARPKQLDCAAEIGANVTVTAKVR